MKRNFLLINMLIVIATATTAWALPENLIFEYQWDPSPMEDSDGHPLTQPDYYEVWIQVNSTLPTMVASVSDSTSYTLHAEQGATYRLRVCAVDSLGRPSVPSEWSDPLIIPRITDVPAPTMADLDPAYPNPFNPSTTLRYAVPNDLASGAPVRLRIHDARGALVRDLEVNRSAGWHTVQWLGRDQHGQAVSSGTYLAQYICGDRRQMTRLTLVK